MTITIVWSSFFLGAGAAIILLIVIAFFMTIANPLGY